MTLSPIKDHSTAAARLALPGLRPRDFLRFQNRLLTRAARVQSHERIESHERIQSHDRVQSHDRKGVVSASIAHHLALMALLASLAIASGCSHPTPAAPPITVAAAADLQFAMEDLIGDFHRSHPAEEVRAVYGSSGNFYQQIQSHAPFDLFLSADIEYPRQLAGQGLATPGSLFTYAAGRIAVWVPNSSKLDVTRGMAALEDASVHHIAIANPEHAPYGRAAAAAMKSAGVYNRVAPKLVLGENIAQTLQFVQSGSADIGIVALALAMAPRVRAEGRYWEVPLDTYPAIEQGGAILTRARHSKVATDFREYLVSPPGREILKRYGFSLPLRKD